MGIGPLRPVGHGSLAAANPGLLAFPLPTCASNKGSYPRPARVRYSSGEGVDTESEIRKDIPTQDDKASVGSEGLSLIHI